MSEGKKGVKSARFDLLPFDALWQVALVYGKGAEKYAERNWERGYEWSKTLGAMLRHLSLFWQGQERDDESGLPHLAHAAWHALALLTFYLRQTGVDDRPLAYDPVLSGLLSMTAEVTNPNEIAEARAEVVGTFTDSDGTVSLSDLPQARCDSRFSHKAHGWDGGNAGVFYCPGRSFDVT